MEESDFDQWAVEMGWKSQKLQNVYDQFQGLTDAYGLEDAVQAICNRYPHLPVIIIEYWTMQGSEGRT